MTRVGGKGTADVGAGLSTAAQFGDTTLPGWVIGPARRTVAGHAADAAEARLLLEMLGLLDTPQQTAGAVLCAGSCGRPVRPPRSDPGRYPPGTVEVAALAMCQTCYRTRTGPRRSMPVRIPDVCRGECERPLRPKGTSTTEYPGTVTHHKDGRCRTCYRHAQKGTAA